jgi:pimeloyl-ACP methyl ester carboxylesterase
MKYFVLPPSLISIFIWSIIPATAADVALPRSAAIVIGFVGGMVGRSNAVRSEVQLAARLRKDYPTGVQVRMFENRHGSRARREILQLLDTNRDGQLSNAEKRDARITIYGHSWGASEAIALARALGEQRIPVLLTIQVDSVRKPGENDELIPANVAQAVNFFQRDGLLHGRSEIRADDSSRTQILGNFGFDYKAQRVDLEGYPWYARLFMKPHIEIESDPSVWGRVEFLIRSKLPQAKTNMAAAQ